MIVYESETGFEERLLIIYFQMVMKRIVIQDIDEFKYNNPQIHVKQ